MSKKMTAKLLLLVSLLTALSLVVSCTPVVAPTAAPAAAEPAEEKFTIRWSGQPLGQAAGVEDTPVERILEERFNVELKPVFTGAAGAEYVEKLNLMLASGDVPDLIFVYGLTDVAKWAQQGLIAPGARTPSEPRSRRYGSPGCGKAIASAVLGPSAVTAMSMPPGSGVRRVVSVTSSPSCTSTSTPPSSCRWETTSFPMPAPAPS